MVGVEELWEGWVVEMSDFISRETRSGVAKCRLFSQATCVPDHSRNLACATHLST